MIEDKAPLRVMVVDDHPMMRRGVIGVLSVEPDLVVVAEAADGEVAVRQYFEHRPDIVLMDMMMPRVTGVEAIKAIREKDPAACILALTTFAGDAHVRRAMEAGAAGYVLKSTVCQGVADLLRSAHAGHRVISSELMSEANAGRTQELTGREREVLKLASLGNSNRKIAERLGISEETVKNYVSNVLQKLHAVDRTHAVAIALKRGFLD